MRMRFTRTVTHEFVLDVTLPAEVTMDLDAGLGLEGLSDEGRDALHEALSDSSPSGIPDSAAIDVLFSEVTILAHGTDTPMLGNVHL